MLSSSSFATARSQSDGRIGFQPVLSNCSKVRFDIGTGEEGIQGFQSGPNLLRSINACTLFGQAGSLAYRSKLSRS